MLDLLSRARTASRWSGNAAALLSLLLLPALAAQGSGDKSLSKVSRFSPQLDLVALHPIAMGEGRGDRLLGITRGGGLILFPRDPKTGAPSPSGVPTARIEGAKAALYAIGEVRGDGGAPELLAVTRRGIFAWAIREEGVAAEPQTLAQASRRGGGFLSLRTGEPKAAELLRDVDADGRADVLVPRGESIDLWSREAPTPGAEPNAWPALVKRAALPLDYRIVSQGSADAFEDEFEETIELPTINTRDVNGDGREDVIVSDGRQRSWHLQGPEGGIPAEPSVTVDLDLFKDNSPEAEIAPGRTLAGRGRPRLQSRDLDGDGIEDQVIAHRRKIWVFRADSKGPQFTKPSQILVTSDDVTLLLLVDLDEDQRADLVALKVEVPSAGALFMGALGEFEIQVTALGYRSEGSAKFSLKPKWRRTLTLKLPSLRKILRDPEAILRRFEAVGEQVAEVLSGDFDGDGRSDVVQLRVDERKLRVWWSATGDAADSDGDALLRKVLFEGSATYDLDSLLALLEGIAQKGLGQRTGGRDADQVLGIWPREEGRPGTALVLDRGAGKQPLVAILARRPGPNGIQVAADFYEAR